MSATPNFQPSDHEHPPQGRPAFAHECAFVSENVEAHALGALARDEFDRVERHISTCPRCAHRLEQLSVVTAFLPLLSKPVAPPASALAGVLARIDREPLPAVPAAPPSLNPWQSDDPARSWTIPSSKEAYATSMGSAPSSTASPRKTRVKWDVWAAPLAAMPLVLALAIVGGWAMNTRSNLQNQTSALQAVTKENQLLNAQLLTLPTVTTNSYSQMDFSLDSVDSSKASGSLKQLSSTGGVSVTVWNLPANVKTCQIEVEGMDGRRTSAGMMTIDSSGSGNGTYSLSQPLVMYKYVHVIPVAAGATASSAGSADLLMAQINSNLGETGGTESNSSSR